MTYGDVARLGRHVPPDWAHLDRYPMRPHLDAVAAPPGVTARYWPVRLPYDQGDTPECVGYSAAQCMTAVLDAQGQPGVRFDGDAIYQWANAHDGLPAPHDGSTVRAGFQCLTTVGADQLAATGAMDAPKPVVDRLGRYVWSQSADDVVHALLTTGPVVLGINWYEGMFTVGADWYVRLGGGLAGGHGIIAHAVDVAAERVTLKNQWKGWGWPGPDDPGDVFLSLADLARLLGEDGEACLALPEYATPA